MNLFMGIDTSAYTTSVALVDEDGRIVADERIVLKVEQGKRGLRQSDAHFAHLRNLPVLMERVAVFFRQNNLTAIGVSDRPRRLPDSYMPVFLAGLGVARCSAAVKGCPLYQFSHQEGHVAAVAENNLVDESDFLAVHFSGGTSEILLVEKDSARFHINLVLGTTDLNAGQLVDRVGVALGLPFPAGAHLEKIARDEPTAFGIPSVVDERGFSFSGAEAAALRLVEQGVPRETVAFLVFKVIAKTLEKGLRKAVESTGVKQVIMAGGVMANAMIRHRLEQRLDGAGITLYWSQPHLSTDNAVGAAFMTRKSHYLENGVSS